MRELIVIDGFNVRHAGVLTGRHRAGWWRPEGRAALLEALTPLIGGPADIRVVFDARRDDAGEPAPAGAGGIAVILAPHADDRIVEEVLREAPRRPVTAVTSDRDLARRAQEAGTRVVGAGAFLADLAGGRPG